MSKGFRVTAVTISQISDVRAVRLRRLSEVVIRILLGLTFILSSAPKIRQPYDFLSSVYQYELVGPRSGVFISMIVPWLELTLGICFLGGFLRAGAYLTAALLAAIFTTANGWAVHRSLLIACDCFGPGSEQVGYFTVARSAGLAVLGLVGFFLARRRAVESGPRRPAVVSTERS